MDDRIAERCECGGNARSCGCEKQCRDCGRPLGNPRRITWMEYGPICRECNDKRFRKAVDAAGGMR